MAVPLTPNRLLLVENEPYIRDALRMLLEEEGDAVDTAENSQVGLQRLRADVPPFIILLDLSIPVMDGRQFRDEQLADPQLVRIPVVVYSVNPPDPVNAEHVRAVAYLRKPGDFDALLSTIRAVAES